MPIPRPPPGPQAKAVAAAEGHRPHQPEYHHRLLHCPSSSPLSRALGVRSGLERSRGRARASPTLTVVCWSAERRNIRELRGRRRLIARKIDRGRIPRAADSALRVLIRHFSLVVRATLTSPSLPGRECFVPHVGQSPRSPVSQETLERGRAMRTSQQGAPLSPRLCAYGEIHIPAFPGLFENDSFTPPRTCTDGIDYAHRNI
ncbi:MAG: hypothetical protein MZV70_30200 [Desulfobacterales bacterium]|nr:hypothetical protein [Desulfobacterales bacterium]